MPNASAASLLLCLLGAVALLLEIPTCVAPSLQEDSPMVPVEMNMKMDFPKFTITRPFIFQEIAILRVITNEVVRIVAHERIPDTLEIVYNTASFNLSEVQGWKLAFAKRGNLRLTYESANADEQIQQFHVVPLPRDSVQIVVVNSLESRLTVRLRDFVNNRVRPFAGQKVTVEAVVSDGEASTKVVNLANAHLQKTMVIAVKNVRARSKKYMVVFAKNGDLKLPEYFTANNLPSQELSLSRLRQTYSSLHFFTLGYGSFLPNNEVDLSQHITVAAHEPAGPPPNVIEGVMPDALQPQQPQQQQSLLPPPSQPRFLTEKHLNINLMTLNPRPFCFQEIAILRVTNGGVVQVVGSQYTSDKLVFAMKPSFVHSGNAYSSLAYWKLMFARPEYLDATNFKEERHKFHVVRLAREWVQITTGVLENSGQYWATFTAHLRGLTTIRPLVGQMIAVYAETLVDGGLSTKEQVVGRGTLDQAVYLTVKGDVAVVDGYYGVLYAKHADYSFDTPVELGSSYSTLPSEPFSLNAIWEQPRRMHFFKLELGRNFRYMPNAHPPLPQGPKVIKLMLDRIDAAKRPVDRQALAVYEGDDVVANGWTSTYMRFFLYDLADPLMEEMRAAKKGEKEETRLVVAFGKRFNPDGEYYPDLDPLEKERFELFRLTPGCWVNFNEEAKTFDLFLDMYHPLAGQPVTLMIEIEGEETKVIGRARAPPSAMVQLDENWRAAGNGEYVLAFNTDMLQYHKLITTDSETLHYLKLDPKWYRKFDG